MTDLERFEQWTQQTPISVVLEWAKKPGHELHIKRYLISCYQCLMIRKEQETEALIERQARD
jgi:hypothetical protein